VAGNKHDCKNGCKKGMAIGSAGKVFNCDSRKPLHQDWLERHQQWLAKIPTITTTEKKHGNRNGRKEA